MNMNNEASVIYGIPLMIDDLFVQKKDIFEKKAYCRCCRKENVRTKHCPSCGTRIEKEYFVKTYTANPVFFTKKAIKIIEETWGDTNNEITLYDFLLKIEETRSGEDIGWATIGDTNYFVVGTGLGSSDGSPEPVEQLSSSVAKKTKASLKKYFIFSEKDLKTYVVATTRA